MAMNQNEETKLEVPIYYLRTRSVLYQILVMRKKIWTRY